MPSLASLALRLLTTFLGLATLAALAACGDGQEETATVPAGGIPGPSIAFVGRDPGSSPAIYVLSAEGGEPIRISRDDEDIIMWLGWSPDGQRLAFIAWSGPSETTVATPGAGEAATPTAEDLRARRLVVINADGSDQRTLADSLIWHSSTPPFRWSPDSSRIIYTAIRDVNEQPLQAVLRVVDVTTGSDVPLAEERPGFLAAWSPDGSQIAFGAYVDAPDESGSQESELFVMDSDGTNVRQLASRPGPDIGPVWSPDGARIAWWGPQPEGGGNSLFMVDVASGEITVLGEGSEPVWLPDSKHIGFPQEQELPGVIQTPPDVDIMLMNVETGEQTNLTSNRAPDIWPAWSPDGEQIAFVSTRDGPEGEIYLMNADGSDVRRLTENGMVELMLTWRPQ